MDNYYHLKLEMATEEIEHIKGENKKLNKNL